MGNINKNNTNLYLKYYTINLIFTKRVKIIMQYIQQKISNNHDL